MENVKLQTSVVAELSSKQTSSSVLVSSTWGLVLSLTIFLLFVQNRTASRKLNLPPGPANWPIVGGLFLLGPRLHRSFAELAKKYGPIFYMKMGCHPVIVLSHPAVIEELYKLKDAEFASRPVDTISHTAAKYIGFDQSDIGFATYTPHLKLLRKISTMELSTGSKLTANEKIRAKEIAYMLQDVADASMKGKAVDLKLACHTFVTNVLCQVLFGRRLYDGNPLTGQWKDFRKMVMDQPIVAAKLNLADLHPLLGWLSSKAVLREYQDHYKQARRIFSGIIEEHRKARKLVANKEDKDFVDKLLSYQEAEPGSFTEDHLMGVLSDMLVGGNDTSASTIEFTFLELIRSPLSMAKLQVEIERVVGKDRLVQDSDIPNLPYLQAVLKEDFRLHNPVPLLLPHCNPARQVLGGYDIPANSAVFINTYASCRDPSVWENPEVFNPDRFMGSEVGLHGNHSKYTPFGSGRRKCVGLGLGMALTHRCVASLVQAFEWSPPPGINPADISAEEGDGVVTRCKYPLHLCAVPRLPSSLFSID